MKAIIHYDPPSHIPGIAQNVRACDKNCPINRQPVHDETRHLGSGDVNAVTCDTCKRTPEFKAANVDSELPNQDVHWHQEGEPLWTCGHRNGQASGEKDVVTCLDCIALFPPEKKVVPDGELSVSTPLVHEEGRGQVRVEGTEESEVSAVQP